MRQLLSLIITTFLVASCDNNKATNQSVNKTTTDSVLKVQGETVYVAKQDDYYKNQVGTQKLKGNYEVYYTTDDSFKYVYLKRDTVIRKLNSLPLDEGSFYYLGIVLADYENSFLFGHDNGNGAPYTIELINKSTGKNIFKNSVVSIDGNYDEDFLVYYDDTNDELKHKFVLYNLTTGNKEYFDLPEDIFKQAFDYNFFGMTVDTIMKREIKVSYDMDTGTLTKMYSR